MGILTGVDAYLESNLDIRSRTGLCSFMRSSWSLVTLIGAYLLLVLLGPRLMKRRKPFTLKKVLIAYNILQVFVNAHFLYRMLRYYFFSGEYNFWCTPVGYNRNDDFGMFVYVQTMYFFGLKVLDMTDTLFFVLRNKPNQITFLHVFHHISLATIMWIALLLHPGGNMSLTSSINAFVHVLMYAYYLMTALNVPHLSAIKPYMTTIQLVQFVVNTAHLTITTVFGTCEMPVNFQRSVIFLNICFFWMFMQFYRKSYTKKETNVRKVK